MPRSPRPASCTRSDAFVVLSHDRAVDGPALAAALAGRAGYVGALGSRRTQAARREWLTEHGVAAADQARIHGPAGLDIDAHTPGEIAVTIVAEILGRARAASSGGALRDRSGPVHTAGVQRAAAPLLSAALPSAADEQLPEGGQPGRRWSGPRQPTRRGGSPPRPRRARTRAGTA